MSNKRQIVRDCAEESANRSKPSDSPLSVWKPQATPTSSPSGVNPKCRRSLHTAVKESEIAYLFEMSDGSGPSEDSDDDDGQPLWENYPAMRSEARQLRDQLGEDEVGDEWLEEQMMREYSECFKNVRGVKLNVEESRVEVDLEIERSKGDISADRVEVNVEAEGMVGVIGSESVGQEIVGESPSVIGPTIGGDDAAVGSSRPDLDLSVFSWSDDFSTFSGQEETYIRSPGPQTASQDPVDLFLEVWDREIVEKIVTETNRFARQELGKLAETEGGIRPYLCRWTDTSVDEIYRFFALLSIMSINAKEKVKDYWANDDLEGMPGIKTIMSRDRYILLVTFLHFTDNETQPENLTAYEKKYYKIRSIIDHCNEKFSSMYTPDKYLNLDESLLLWKARFGMMSYELSEASTGYLLKYSYLLYAGKDSSMHPQAIQGFDTTTAKVVLELMDGYLDVGHILFMDNWYNQIPLTRYLKVCRHTDVVGTMNRLRLHVPDDIKDVAERNLVCGEQVARHCGDITLVAWKDVKVVTMVSTFHTDARAPGRCAGLEVTMPVVVNDYNKNIGGVDSKDQMLSAFLLERKRDKKWYHKIFKRMLTSSFFNTHVIHKQNKTVGKELSHRNFRRSVARGLLQRFAEPQPNVTVPQTTAEGRLRLGHHFAVHAPIKPGTTQHQRKRCARCAAATPKKNTYVTSMCSLCNVHLCVGECYVDWHTKQCLSD